MFVPIGTDIYGQQQQGQQQDGSEGGGYHHYEYTPEGRQLDYSLDYQKDCQGSYDDPYAAAELTGK